MTSDCRAIGGDQNLAIRLEKQLDAVPLIRYQAGAGAGACLITDEWDGIELFLEPDREVLVAADSAAVAGHLDGLSLERARAIGERGRARVLAHHTYRQRAVQFNNLLEGMSTRIEAAE